MSFCMFTDDCNGNGFGNAAIYQTANQIAYANHIWNQVRTYRKNILDEMRSYDISSKREYISQYLPLPSIPQFHVPYDLDECIDESIFTMGQYFVDNTPIDIVCGILLFLIYVASACRGRIIVKNGKHIESSVLWAIAFAKSGLRKSTVAERLNHPILAFESKIKKEYGKNLGSLSKKVAMRVTDRAANNILDQIDFADHESVLQAINEAQRQDEFYNRIKANQLPPPNICVSDVTPFQLGKLMRDNGEAQNLFSSEGSAGEKTLLHNEPELLLKSHDQEPFVRSSAKCHIDLENPALYIALFAQPDIAQKLYGSYKLGSRGITPRILPYFNINHNPRAYYLNGNEEEVYRGKLTALYQKLFTREQKHENYVVELDVNADIAIRNFRAKLDTISPDLPPFTSWLDKLHGQAMRLAFAIHLWNNTERPLASQITQREMEQGIYLAENTMNPAWFLYSPYGLEAALNAIRIIRSYQERLCSDIERNTFLANGVTTTMIQQRTKIDRIKINDALVLMAHLKWVALHDDGSGNFKVLPNWNFFRIKVTEL